MVSDEGSCGSGLTSELDSSSVWPFNTAENSICDSARDDVGGRASVALGIPMANLGFFRSEDTSREEWQRLLHARNG